VAVAVTSRRRAATSRAAAPSPPRAAACGVGDGGVACGGVAVLGRDFNSEVKRSGLLLGQIEKRENQTGSTSIPGQAEPNSQSDAAQD
jgi:hypothetical protein